MSAWTGWKWIRIAILAVAVAAVGSKALAHQPGESYLFLEVRENGVSGRAEYPVAMMHRLFGEAPAVEQLQQYTRRVLSFREDAGQIEYELDKTKTLELEGLAFSQVWFKLTGSEIPLELTVRFAPFDDPESSRQALLVLSKNAYDPSSVSRSSAGNVILAFTPSEPEQRVRIPTKGSGKQFVAFLKRGLNRAWKSPEHAIFLLALLLPAVLRRGTDSDGTWEAVPDRREGLRNAGRTVLIFGLALALGAVLSQVNALEFPVKLVESVTAIGIAAAGILLLLLPEARGKVLLLVLGFSLFHGFALGAAVSHLVTGGRTATIVLGGFGVGFGAALLALVALVFPLLFLLRRRPSYLKVLLPGAGIVLVALGLWWTVERAF